MIPNMIPTPVVEQCKGCNVIENGFCRAYANPEYKWSGGLCNHRDVPEVKLTTVQKKMNALKASKRAKAGHLHLRKYSHKREFSKKPYVDNIDLGRSPGTKPSGKTRGK